MNFSFLSIIKVFSQLLIVCIKIKLFFLIDICIFFKNPEPKNEAQLLGINPANKWFTVESSEIYKTAIL